MVDVLLFTLYAPLASFGDIAVGERRAGFDRPGRSAMLGLLAGALGLDRRDDAGQQALDETFDFALRVEAAGQLTTDYHTVQAPPAKKGRQWATRREAMAEAKLETLISSRDYRADPLCTVALVRRDTAAEGLLTPWAAALARPCFTPYLGRKSCPLGLPLRPAVMAVDGLDQAFIQYDAARPAPEKEVRASLRLRNAARYYADDGIVTRGLHDPAFVPVRREERRDQVRSRSRWQFALRGEWLIAPKVAEATS